MPRTHPCVVVLQGLLPGETALWRRLAWEAGTAAAGAHLESGFPGSWPSRVTLRLSPTLTSPNGTLRSRKGHRGSYRGGVSLTSRNVAWLGTARGACRALCLGGACKACSVFSIVGDFGDVPRCHICPQNAPAVCAQCHPSLTRKSGVPVSQVTCAVTCDRLRFPCCQKWQQSSEGPQWSRGRLSAKSQHTAAWQGQVRPRAWAALGTSTSTGPWVRAELVPPSAAWWAPCSHAVGLGL